MPDLRRRGLRSGPRVRSDAVKDIPVGIGGVAAVVRSAVVDTHIPLLASRHLMTQLDAILDLIEFKAHFHNINMTVPLIRLGNSHLAVSIQEWPASGLPTGADAWGRAPGRGRGHELWLEPESEATTAPEPGRVPIVHLPD